MRGPIRSVLLAAVAACALSALTVGSASAATIKAGTNNLLAIYGNPGTNGASVPVGGGLGRNFGFGENMVFQAGNGVGTALSITLLTKIAKAEESLIGGTLMSNQSGEGNALSFTIQSVDFQDNNLGAEATPSYADTSDRPWITEICGVKEPGHEAKECRIDPQLSEAAAAGRTVKIEDVSFALKNAVVGTVVVQGTAWGKWENGEAKKPPCITLEPPPAGAGANQTLIDTQGGEVGKPITAISGKACLISANNDWFTAGAKSEPAIVLKNE
jgi:hypothetical protein